MVLRLVLICCIVWFLVRVLSVLMKGIFFICCYSLLVLCLVRVYLMGRLLCRWMMFLVV